MSQQKPSGNNPLFQGHIKAGVSVPGNAPADPAPEDTPAAEQSPDSGDDTPKQ